MEEDSTRQTVPRVIGGLKKLLRLKGGEWFYHLKVYGNYQ